MLEEILLKIFSDTGIVAGLFVATFLGFIWKGIPAIFKKFEDITYEHKQEIRLNQENFQKSFDSQRVTFEKTMNDVVKTFNEQIQKSNDWHERHSNTLGEIKQVLKNLK